MILPLPEGRFEAYLFDCDGTIVDNMPQHYVAWKAALDPHGAEFPEDQFYGWGGRPARDIIHDLNARYGLAMPVDEVNEARERAFTELSVGAAAVPGVLEHIENAYGTVPFAVVSGSTRDAVVASLTALGLLEKFDTLVCAGEYTRPKPDPECYLKAAGILGVDPAACVVFEDTELGVQAAQAAGMAYVRVPPPTSRR